MHLHVVHRHDQDHRHRGPQALGYAYPYEDAWKAGGEIIGSDPRPRHRDPAPGHRRSGRVPRARHRRARTPTRPRPRSCSRRPATRPSTRSSSCSRPTTRQRRRREERDRQGARGRRLQATPIASTLEKIRTTGPTRSADQRPLQRLVLGLADRRFVVPGSVGGSLVGLEGMPNPAQFKEAAWTRSRSILDTMTPRRPPAWGEFDKTHGEEVLPGGQHRLLRHGDDPRAPRSVAWRTTTSAACRRSPRCTSPSELRLLSDISEMTHGGGPRRPPPSGRTNPDPPLYRLIAGPAYCRVPPPGRATSGPGRSPTLSQRSHHGCSATSSVALISGLLVLLVVSMVVFALFFYGPAGPAPPTVPESRCTPQRLDNLTAEPRPRPTRLPSSTAST